MTDKYDGPERRSEAHLSEAQMDEIAERAAVRAIQKLTDEAYKSIGKGVVSKLLWMVGVVTVALYLGVKNNGLFNWLFK